MTKKNKKSSSSEPDEEGSRSSRLVAIPKDQNDNSGLGKSKSDRIGDVLHDARQKRGDDLYLIAEYLCIKPAFLIALENSRYDEFPADAYVIGFLRTYANFLGIDGKEAVDRYRYEMAGRRKKPILSMPIPVPEGRIPSFIIIVGAVVALIVIYSIWYSFASYDRAEVRLPPTLPTTLQTAAAPSAETSAAAGLTAPVSSPPAPTPIVETPQSAPAPVPAVQDKKPEATEAPASLIPPASPGIVVTAEKQTPVPKAETSEKTKNQPPKEEKKPETKPAEEKKPLAEVKPTKDVQPAPEEKQQPTPVETTSSSHVVIRATQDSWVMVVDDSGKTLFDHVMKSGDAYNVPNKSGLSLTTGNGSGIILSVDGTDLSKIASGPPHMVRNISLDPNRLKSQYGVSH